MFPLLALGLMGGALGGADWYQRLINRQSDETGASQVQSLLGSAPREMGPPTEDGTMGQMPGQGLLGNMGDPATQAQFMQGLLTLPSAQRQAASQMYSDLFQRLQQGQQFQQTDKRMAGQFSQSQAQDASQFGQRLRQQEDQARTQADQWQKTFDASRQEAAQRLAIEQARLNLERARAGGGAGGLPPLEKGWGYINSASGIVAAPMPGTKPYADATQTEQTLAGAVDNINRFQDIYAGKQQGPNGTRVGGSGNAYSGARSGELSTVRGKIISDVAKLQDLGVLQKGDLERLDAMLTDPSHLSVGAVLSTKGGVLGAYQELGDQFKTKLQQHRNANPWLLPPPPPGALIDGAPGRPLPAAPSRPSGSRAAAAPGASSSVTVGRDRLFSVGSDQ